jgi:hypothetical protein
VPVRVNCAGESACITLRPQANPETDTFMVAAQPQSLTFDPDNWVLDSSYVTGIAEPGQNPRHGPAVLSIAPSPARGGRAIRFTLDARGATRLEVRDLLGRVVARLPADGKEEAVWRPQLPAGVYFVQLTGTETGPLTRFVLTE